MGTKGGLIPNPDCEIIKIKTKTRHVRNNNPIIFYYKKGIKQGYDKETYPKLVLNK
jgi:hypothetical protein